MSHSRFCRRCGEPTKDYRNQYCSRACFDCAKRDAAVVGIPRRFWTCVQKTETCWLWTGGRDQKGYGTFALPNRRAHFVRVHRYAYELEVGPIPAGLSVLHHCDVRNCLNPAHLFLGTQGDNVRDAAMKGRYPRGEQHPWARLTVDDVRYIRAAYADTDCRLKDLAERFGITESAAARIVKRRRWSHVP